MNKTKPVRKTKRMRIIEEQLGCSIDELLKDLYGRMNLEEISAYIEERGVSVSIPTLSQWLFRLGIPTERTKKFISA